ncbi:hypothetical protein B0A55_11708 [Friedmanniomyces simplex]|uniref:Uncharacterized protein n=1 Tax=Friedmanniomyces simplex TaxID=329884 RepID=A0A4U0WPG3_9PEZI|nr:hypothetical protein B0A55_11708 [Friedmanniomyces simplex]
MLSYNIAAPDQLLDSSVIPEVVAPQVALVIVFEESRQRYMAALASGLEPAYYPPLQVDPRISSVLDKVFDEYQQVATTANVCDLESASSSVLQQPRACLPKIVKHYQVAELQAKVYTDMMRLDALEAETMCGSEPSSVPVTYEQPRMGRRRIDIMTAENALAAGAPLSHPSLKAFRTAHDPPRPFRFATSRFERQRMAEVYAEAALTTEMPGPTFVEPTSTPPSSVEEMIAKYRSQPRPFKRAIPLSRRQPSDLASMIDAPASCEKELAPPQTSVEDLIAKYQSQPRPFKRAVPLSRRQPIELAPIIDAPAYRSEPPASTPAPVADDAVVEDVDDACIVDYTEWDRRFEIAEARRQEHQTQPEPELESEVGDNTGMLSRISSWARSAMAWVKEKVWG